MLRSHSRAKRGRAPNVYLYSVLRQPVRTALLLCMLGFVCFAFASRVAEALYIWRETGAVERSYHAIGYLQPLAEQDADASAAADALEHSGFVQLVDRRKQASGVLQGEYNVDWSSIGTEQCEHGDVFVSGRFQGVRPAAWGGYEFYFAVDSVLAGYPEYVQAGDIITLASSRTDGAQAADAAQALEQMVRGGRYLVRGRYDRNDPSCTVKANLGLGSKYFSVDAFVFVPLDGEGLWSWPLAEGEEADLSLPALQAAAQEMERIDRNQRAVVLSAIQDVSLNAAVQEGASAYYLAEGRWPDGADNAAGTRVCAVHEGFASARGLSVGDSITMALRDAPDGYLYGDAARQSEAQRLTQAESYEIVGIYNDHIGSASAFGWNFVFVPQAVLPASFGAGRSLHGNACSFVLTSPARQQAFQEEMGPQLAELEFQAVLLETNWDTFYSTAHSMRRAALWNTLLYAAALLGTLALAMFLYLYSHKKEIAVARALGLPPERCVRQLVLPLLLLGLVGTTAGCAAGWQDAQRHATETLRVLEEFGGSATVQALPLWWFAGLCAGVWLLLLAGAAGAARAAAGRSVLTLLQGGISDRKSVV